MKILNTVILVTIALTALCVIGYLLHQLIFYEYDGRMCVRRTWKCINRFAMACIRFGVAIIDRHDDVATIRFRRNGKGYHLFVFRGGGNKKAAECYPYLKEYAEKQKETLESE